MSQQTPSKSGGRSSSSKRPPSRPAGKPSRGKNTPAGKKFSPGKPGKKAPSKKAKRPQKPALNPDAKKGQIQADPIRLHKALARAGVASRRKAEEMILEGRVRVNNATVQEMGMKIDPISDDIRVDGRKVSVPSESHHDKVYLLLHKPAGVLTTTKDDRGRRTVMELISNVDGTRLFPVGRLDFDSEGALLLTNDGDLAHALTHPKYHVAKTYAAKVKGTPKEADLDKLRRGIYLDDGPTNPAHVEVLGKARINTWVEITITEGRNRLVKRMFWRIRHPVMKLVRTEFAGLTLDGLPPGKSRLLTKREVARLKELATF